MSTFREISMLLRNTFLVTALVIAGFLVGSAVGLPVWLQGFCLIPAGIVFYKLTGGPRPKWIRVVGFLCWVSAHTYVFTVLFPRSPDGWKVVSFALLWMSYGWLNRPDSKSGGHPQCSASIGAS